MLGISVALKVMTAGVKVLESKMYVPALHLFPSSFLVFSLLVLVFICVLLAKQHDKG